MPFNSGSFDEATPEQIPLSPAVGVVDEDEVPVDNSLEVDIERDETHDLNFESSELSQSQECETPLQTSLNPDAPEFSSGQCQLDD